VKKSIGIYGAGGFGREIMPMLKHGCRIFDSKGRKIKVKESFFIETDPKASQINGYEIISEEDLNYIGNPHVFFSVAIADSRVREKIAHRMEVNGHMTSTLIDKTAILHASSSLGEGAILSHLAIVTANTNIGKYFHGNYRSYVAHDCTIDDFVTFAPGASCNGNVKIDEHVYVGSNATIKQGTASNPIHIGKNSIIGMGAVVIKDVPENVVVAGNPARVIRTI
jgi:sugar O-acyltransferase (sialic acid O-acetyltransferase NeuD family)